ncbi:phosphonate metabolism protein PhnH [Mesobacillus campisalis]|uniref:Phosphonate metabolism protein PhnH n=1 Tax=Mesobacillus campisalis TaxID=1408103 RepID=A0A0M2SQU9_9BACI|nr:phosphonate C-P lyase system protein PhnH [Mesobacillus campisalis]KKK36573.1 phosphonate metabolism protein PhnH [Mesobacillus campisalis]
MKLDAVHYLQAVYRKMVDSASRPGHISDLRKEAGLAGTITGCSPSLLVMALTLLDQEVTFSVISNQADKVSKLINQLTYAKQTETAYADYIFILGDASRGALAEAIEKAKPGTLKNPHGSGTIIAEVDSVISGDPLFLTGPGIEETETVFMNVRDSWVEARRDKNREFPLGVDLMFIDQHHQLLYLPRTTQITESQVVA